LPFTTVTTPQNLAVMSATVAGPAVSTPLWTVPTRPSSYGAPGGPWGLGTQSAGSPAVGESGSNPDLCASAVAAFLWLALVSRECAGRAE
jgi:hypothetical protein